MGRRGGKEEAVFSTCPGRGGGRGAGVSLRSVFTLEKQTEGCRRVVLKAGSLLAAPRDQPETLLKKQTSDPQPRPAEGATHRAGSVPENSQAPQGFRCPVVRGVNCGREGPIGPCRADRYPRKKAPASADLDVEGMCRSHGRVLTSAGFVRKTLWGSSPLRPHVSDGEKSHGAIR